MHLAVINSAIFPTWLQQKKRGYYTPSG